MNNTRIDILRRLASGDFVSGEQLGQDLGISRAAISKHINALSELDLDIFRVTGKGYKLEKPLQLLSVDEMLTHQPSIQSNNIEVHYELDSTNSYLLRYNKNQLAEGQVCFAEYQSAGRGRRGRQWISPFASNIYMSQYRFLEQGMSAAMGLSIVAAIALFDTIFELYQQKVQLKWPNDVYLNHKKLAGILIDLDGQPLDACHCVIGIGLNLTMPDSSAKLVDQPWSQLSTLSGIKINRNQIAATLVKHLNLRFSEHQLHGLNNMLPTWLDNDIYLGKQVKIITGNNETIGISRGIDNQGALLLEKGNEITPIYGGEVSLRSAE